MYYRFVPLLILAVALLQPAIAAGPSVPVLDGAKYLVIAADELVDAVRPLAEWKTLKGLQARVVSLSETGRSPEDVQYYIRQAFETWPVPPEYVLIAASPEDLRGYRYEDDCYYGDMAGDYLMELPVGRLPAETPAECQLMVRRILTYEQLPDTSDIDWLLQGSTVVNEESPPDQYYQADSRLARTHWLAHGYTVAESICNLYGHRSSNVTAALNDGRAFITYRGIAGGFWTRPFHQFWPNSTWQNGDRTPVFVSATCFTVSLAPDEDMLGNVTLRYGDPTGLGGALAFFGTTRGSHRCSHYRSAVYRGFFDAVFNEGEHRLGPATLRARFRVDSLYHEEFYYTEWCLLGDPAMDIWTARPQPLAVEHDTIVGTEPRQFEVVVTSRGTPVSEATVCLSMDSTVLAAGTTDPAGRALLDIDQVRPGPMNVVVTGRNRIPYLGECAVRAFGRPYVVYQRHTIADSQPGGNGDGWPGPGETVGMPTWVVNLGDSSASGLTGVLRTTDSLVAVSDSIHRFGTVPGCDSACTGPDGYDFNVDEACPDGHLVTLQLQCTDSGGADWLSDISFRIGAAEVLFTDTLFLDPAGNGNRRLDPRETAFLVVEFENRGFGHAVDARAVLRTRDARLEVRDSVSLFGTVPGKTRFDNSADPFEVTAGHMLPETQVSCTLEFTAVGREWTFPLVITVGELDARDPIPDGPREPARYWAYDDIDTAYAEAPDFEWVELRGLGDSLPLNDDQTVPVPFPDGFGPFRYYGHDYQWLSICSNGRLNVGWATDSSWIPRRLPWAGVPPVLAVYWQDWNPASGGSVYRWHDAARHRFIVEWDSVPDDRRPGSFGTFQVMIYDTTSAAADGNCEVVFQYRHIDTLASGSVGIQNEPGTVGLPVLFGTWRNKAAGPVTAGRAIRFTTDPPIVGVHEPASAVALQPSGVSLAVFPNPSRGFATVRWQVPVTGKSVVTVYDIAGRRVRMLAGGPPGSRIGATTWDGTDAAGTAVSAGVYVVRLESPSGSAACKLVVRN